MALKAGGIENGFSVAILFFAKTEENPSSPIIDGWFFFYISLFTQC